MATQGFVQTLIASQVDGAALSNTTTATSITHGTALIQLVPQYFYIGKSWRLRATGRISTVVTTPGTLLLEMRFGSVLAFTSGLMTLNIVAKTNVGWILDVLMTCRAIGTSTSANLIGQGTWTSEAVIGNPLPTVGGSASHVLPYNTAPVVGGGFDSTAAQTPNLFATWSVANAANSIQCHQMIIVDMN